MVEIKESSEHPYNKYRDYPGNREIQMETQVNRCVCQTPPHNERIKYMKEFKKNKGKLTIKYFSFKNYINNKTG